MESSYYSVERGLIFMAEKTFTITCTMEERWIDHFMSMLNYMQYCGHIGRSRIIGFYSDGDGDFRPEFVSDIEYNNVDGRKYERIPEVVYDAG